jgi:hypothetical protein
MEEIFSLLPLDAKQVRYIFFLHKNFLMFFREDIHRIRWSHWPLSASKFDSKNQKLPGERCGHSSSLIRSSSGSNVLTKLILFGGRSTGMFSTSYYNDLQENSLEGLKF